MSAFESCILQGSSAVDIVDPPSMMIGQQSEESRSCCLGRMICRENLDKGLDSKVESQSKLSDALALTYSLVHKVPRTLTSPNGITTVVF